MYSNNLYRWKRIIPISYNEQSRKWCSSTFKYTTIHVNSISWRRFGCKLYKCSPVVSSTELLVFLDEGPKFHLPIYDLSVQVFRFLLSLVHCLWNNRHILRKTTLLQVFLASPKNKNTCITQINSSLSHKQGITNNVRLTQVFTMMNTLKPLEKGGRRIEFQTLFLLSLELIQFLLSSSQLCCPNYSAL